MDHGKQTLKCLTKSLKTACDIISKYGMLLLNCSASVESEDIVSPCDLEPPAHIVMKQKWVTGEFQE